MQAMDTRAGLAGCPHSPLLSMFPSFLPHCRLRIPPFEKARTVLEALKQHRLVRVQERKAHSPTSEA